MNKSFQELRQERKLLKQKLFKIRLFVEGDLDELDEELIDLKAHYESVPGFTSWSYFPERWDIGDPHRVKSEAFAFNEIDKRNYQRIAGKDYEEIVFLEQELKLPESL